MDKYKLAVYHMIPYLDDCIFETFAGLYNAQQLQDPAEEAALMRTVLDEEYQRTQDPELLHLIQKLDKYLQ